MHQLIKRKHLQPGMFVVSYGQGTFHSPLVRVAAHIFSPSQIDELVPADVEDVLIDTSGAMPLPLADRVPVGAPFSVEFGEELHIARKLYSDALDYVKTFVDGVRKGTDINLSQATALVDSFIESVFRNESAAVTLFKLRGFDEYTYTHSLNVSILAVLLGKHLGLDKAALLNLGLAGLLHDAGKARVPTEILNKPGRLTESEFEVVKIHPLESVKILRRQKDMPVEVLRAVLEHHERHDGSGYPQGLKGEAIGSLSRIIAVVDVYDALTSQRVYKEAMAPTKALGMMFQWRGQQFAAQDIDNFIRCIGVFPVGSFVRLSGGEFAVVSGINAQRPTRPEVKVVLDARMRPQLPRLLNLWVVEGTAEAQDIAEVLNPAEHKIDLEPFLSV
ncbi:MAG: HD-GYP domain-containing protein [Proteobacteria bacterium]|nr:HD-GYP domain-containing protein [Pseudomonadota bacterium]MBU1595904.1 HD-GYP domain-containing protein [Pseudomonadota bacterium]